MYWDYGEGKTDSKKQTYQGSRDAQGITSFASELLNKADIQPEIHELVSKKVYENECKNAGQVICVIAFLPNIYDSNAEQRNKYLQTVTKVAKTQRSQPFNFFWT